MTDADVDGAHIRTLLMTLFYRYFPELIENGYLYIAQPPLYKISKGKDQRYAYTDEEKEEVLKDMGVNQDDQEEDDDDDDDDADGKPKKKVARANIQRYKGLGEMNPEQLWETTMDPDNRLMLRVTMENAEAADAIFSTLMGPEVPPRKKFIQTHAQGVKNLDV